VQEKTLIYLANLSHTDSAGHPATESIPLNIGFLGSYLLKDLGSKVQIKLFNMPSKLEKSFKKETPHILACSNYTWNYNLNYAYISHFKEKYPHVVTVMGGPNYPGIIEDQERFLKYHNRLDFYIYLEGEIAFLNLIKILSENSFDIETTKENKELKGCHFIIDKGFVCQGSGERLKNIDNIPSPYTTGLFDNMLKDGFVPMIQTNRGCPFSCSYCLSSLGYYNKLIKYDFKRICEEIEHIGEIASTNTLCITDDNFGIFDHDLHIAEKLSESRKRNDWPLKINLCMSKTGKDNVFMCASQLGDAIYFTVSMQSMNQNTLDAVKRKNLSFQQQQEIIGKLKEKKMKSLCELILGLPEETKESHLQGIRDAIEAGIDYLGLYTCMLLKNTPLAEAPCFDKYQMLKRFRIIPRNFGLYLGKRVLEIEEVCVATKNLNLEEYVFLRGFHFVVTNYYNSGAFKEIICYLKLLNISIYEWLWEIHDEIRKDTGKAGEIYNQFIVDTRSELWNSEDEIRQYYEIDDNFHKLLEGKEGTNLLQKYFAIFLDNLWPFIELSMRVSEKNYKIVDSLAMRNLARFCWYMRGDIFNESLVYRKQMFDFDILKWINSGMEEYISQFSEIAALDFYFNKHQKDILKKYLKFYGKKQDSRGKILTRIDPTFLYRDCSYIEMGDD